MSLVTVNDARASRARLNVPGFGAWWAFAELDDEVTLAGSVALQFADLALSGTVVSGGTFRGSSRYWIAGGAAGWGKTIPSKSYRADNGVKLSTVLGDAANACGETLDLATVPATTVGPNYTREEGMASLVLQQQKPEGWHVGEDGVTRIGRRARAELTTEATRVKVDLAAARVDLAADSIASLLPGIVVDGLEAIDVEHTLAEKKIRTTVWGHGAGQADSLLAAQRQLLRLLLPDYRFRGLTEYRVVTQDGERLNLQATAARLGMPDLQRVRVRPGVAGCRADVALGSYVLVAFVNADPGRPAVVAFEDAEGEGFAPSRLDLVGEDEFGIDGLDLSAIGRPVRYGDSIVFPTPGPGLVVALPGAASFSRVRC